MNIPFFTRREKSSASRKSVSQSAYCPPTLESSAADSAYEARYATNVTTVSSLCTPTIGQDYALPYSINDSFLAEVASRKKKRKNFNRRMLALLLAIAVIALLLVVTTCAGSQQSSADPWYDEGAKQGTYVQKTKEDVIQELNQFVEENMMNVTMSSLIEFTNGSTNTAAINFVNLEGNGVDQKLVLTLANSSEVLYESGAVQPGYCLKEIRLTKNLAKGSYKALATITGYDCSTHQKKGAFSIDVLLIVS